MKHCIIKLLVVVAIGMFSLPRLYAQDTTITIYGKNFSPQVIVKLNGITISPINIRHDLLKPSRILYVTIPLAGLKTGTSTVAIGKESGAKLTSIYTQNILFVGNPGTPQNKYAQYNIVAKLPPPSIILRAPDGTTIGSSVLPKLNIFAIMGKDTTITLQVAYSGLEAGSNAAFRFKSSTSPFQILDASGQDIEGKTINLTGRDGTINIRIKFTPQAGLLNDSMYIDLNGELHKTLLFEGIRQIKILAAYTNSTQFPFYKIGSPSPSKTTEVPALYLKDRIGTLNEYIATREPNTSPLYFTRFIFAYDTPVLIVFNESSILTKNIHRDIDELRTTSGVQQQLALDNTIQSVILLVNSDEAQYRAIASECNTLGLPKYIVVEIKYGHTFIEKSLIGYPTPIEEALLEDLRAALR